MPACICLLIIFKIIKFIQKILKSNSFFETSNISFKFDIQFVINNINLIIDVNEFNVFDFSKNTLNIFSRFSIILDIAKNITFSKKRINNDVEKRLETFYKHSFSFVKFISEFDKTFIIFKEFY